MKNGRARPLFVVGHKNPDTDSICSAIAYAHLKSRYLDQPAVPYRAGSLNPQTAFVLERFGVREPDLLQDVYPKIGDMMVPEEDLIVVDPDAPVSEALAVMVKHRFTFLPVVDEDRKLLGKISTLRLAGLADEVAAMAGRSVRCLDLSAFLEAVDAEHVAGAAPPQKFEGYLSFFGMGGVQGGGGGEETGSEGGSMVVVGGDGVSPVEEAIRSGVDTVVVCGKGRVSSMVNDRVKSNSVCVVETGASVFQVAVQLVYAIPVRDFMEKDFPTFGCHDRVRDVQREIAQYHDGGF